MSWKILNLAAFVSCTVGLCAAVSARDWITAGIMGVFSLANFLIYSGVES